MKPQSTWITCGLPLLLLGCGVTAAEAASAKAPPPSEAAPAEPHGEPGARRVEIGSYQDVLDLFETLNYTPEAWQAGIREVPRVFLTEISERWRTHTVNEITVLLKKRLFFRALAPLVLRSNELILEDRKRLAGVRERGAGALSAKDAAGCRSCRCDTM